MGNIRENLSKNPPIEWEGQIVITTAQLAEVYGATPDNINDNFARNKSRFEEGKHYIFLTGKALRDFKSQSAESGLVCKSTSKLYLWTRRGASRHCKILGTDKAWEQFDYLEDNYFDREKRTQQSPPLTLQQQIQTIAQGTAELYERVDKVTADMDGVKSEIETIKNDLPILPIEADEITKAVRRKGVWVLGGKESPAYNNRALRQRVYNNLYANLKYNFAGIRSYKAIRRKDTEKAIKIVEEYRPPLYLADQIAAENAQQSLEFEGGAGE